MKNFMFVACITSMFTWIACDHGEKTVAKVRPAKPEVSADGVVIKFSNAANLSYIKTEKLSSASLKSEATFPARIAGTSVASEEGAGRNIILFEDPELTDNYVSLVQHLTTINQIENVSIKQRKIELDRAKDLAANGAATGKEVLEAETALAMENTTLNNVKAELIEHEAKLKLSGFDPDALLKAPVGKIWVICEIPESMLESVEKGGTCMVYFSSFPEEKFAGNIEAVGDVVNSNTRMVKLRLSIRDANRKMKAGMFAMVSLDHAITNALSVSKQSLITVQGRTYVFIKTGEMQFERREVVIASLINDRAILISGVKRDEEIVTDGAMQLKGLSFGY